VTSKEALGGAETLRLDAGAAPVLDAGPAPTLPLHGAAADHEVAPVQPGAATDHEIAPALPGAVDPEVAPALPGAAPAREVAPTLRLRGAAADRATAPTLPPSTAARVSRINAATLPPEPTAEPWPAAHDLTLDPALATWDRYELLGPLGKGGMGVVYKARDRRLDRVVAIKFLLGVDPGLAMRFLREARAQARIDHPHVCRVYEVGEIAGRAYIALQFVDGIALHDAAPRMSLDGRVAVLRDAALAIHEAHRLGIVHRDLKPANILVEHTADGRWTPIVMDFGLARETTVEIGLTQSGAVLGTPAYMSPEQAHGDVRLIDRRSDVYSLGATLYELLTGRPVFVETSLARALSQVIHDEPPPPRGLVPSLPVDLETIALKCLAKDPAQRYPSARALADDLGRYLDGEPILGRRQSRWQRLRQRARRHRALVAVGASSLAFIAVVGALGVRAWLDSRSERARAAERTVLAGQLGQDTKDAEFFLRSAYLAPLHDTRPERARIRERLAAIAVTHHDLGRLGDAILHDALGRGHLALHDWQIAADELAQAAALGTATPELHAARGRALGELYARALDEARRQEDKAWVARRQRELERQYLAPAVLELLLARSASDSPELIDAQIALFHREFAAAEQLAATAAQRAPWRFEAHKLAADAAYGAAIAVFDRGDYDAARPALERATALYGKASEFARSDASIYEAAAQSQLQLAELDYRQNRSPRAALQRALDVIERAIRAAPDDTSAYTTKGYILLRWSRTPGPDGVVERRALLDRAAEANLRATEIAPRNARAWDALGNVYVYRGISDHYRGRDSFPWWTRALQSFDKALALAPNDAWICNDIGAAHRWQGTALDARGDDPTSEYQVALTFYTQASTIDPNYTYAWSNRADLQLMIAEHLYQAGDNPETRIADIQRAGERSLTLDPNFHLALSTLIRAHILIADYREITGGDPASETANAQHYLSRLEQIRPGAMENWLYRAHLANIQARSLLHPGHDPSDVVRVARAAIGEALRLVPDYPDSHVEAAQVDLIEAKWLRRNRGDATSLLKHARAECERAIALDQNYTDAQITAAEAYLQSATVERSRTLAARGLDYADRAVALAPRFPRAHAVRAELQRLVAPTP